jgi:hypothetical protein
VEIEVGDFVAKTLSEIVRGVQLAQEALAETGAKVNPIKAFSKNESTEHLLEGHSRRLIQEVEFDVAVTASIQKSTEGGMGADIKVFSVGGKGEYSTSSGSSSRVRFRVPMLLPAQPEAVLDTDMPDTAGSPKPRVGQIEAIARLRNSNLKRW